MKNFKLIFQMIRIPKIAILLVFAGLGYALQAQERNEDHRTYFDNLTLDPDGHICYVEFLQDSEFDRIEYREEGRGMISIYQTIDELAKYIETKDFNDDRRPDIITIEWTNDGTDIQRTILYRGPEYEEHLTTHLKHALASASRHIISDRHKEQDRRKEIQRRLDELHNRDIPADEVGVFTTDAGFQPLDHKDVRYAFVAAGNLNEALADIISGDYKILSQQTSLTSEYKLDIDILLMLDPAKYK